MNKTPKDLSKDSWYAYVHLQNHFLAQDSDSTQSVLKSLNLFVTH